MHREISLVISWQTVRDFKSLALAACAWWHHSSGGLVKKIDQSYPKEFVHRTSFHICPESGCQKAVGIY
jgi:hypothetical protein